ncbi:MAG: mechanosensitive ion channel family protein [Methyloceanibacter sp.]|nr:mechanosensitive ion channel family protein [Methyloceanibacter sp.]
MPRLIGLFLLLLGSLAWLNPPQPSFAQDAGAASAQADVIFPSQLTDPQIKLGDLELLTVPLTVDQLKALAGKWLDIVKSKTEQVVDTQIAVSKATGETADAQREKLTKLYAERNDLFDRYSAVLNAWEKKGGDTKEITVYRDYQNAIFLEETRKADTKTLMAWAMDWLMAEDGGIALAKNVAIVIVSFLALLFVARMVRKLVRRWIGHVPNISDLLQAFIVGIVYWIVLAIGLMLVLSGLGVDITPLFALFGGASIIAALAMQDSLSNLASGLMIMIYRPFDVGDYVDVGGVAGTVKSTNIFATTVTTPDNQVIVIPNKNVWGNIITNVTASETRRVDLVFGIGYDDSIPEALKVLQQAVDAHPLVLKDPEPTIRVNELADSSVNLICRPWVKTSDYWTVYWDLQRYVKELFDSVGISIPYPQQDVHFIPADPSKALPTPAIKKTPSTGRPSISAGDEGHNDDGK